MQLLDTNQGASDVEKGQMNVRSSLVADLQTAILVEPGIGSLDNPAVLSKTIFAVDPPSCYARHNAPLPKAISTLSRVISLVGVHLLRAAARPSALSVANIRDRRNAFGQHLTVMHVCACNQDRERSSVPIYHKMALRALFAAIRPCRWPSRFFAPFSAKGAGTLDESALARSQSILSATASLSRQTA